MRKAIKIKTSILLLAWSLIFLHGIIPHTHHDPSDTVCSHSCHHGSQEESNPDKTFNIILLKNIDGGNDHNGIICHFASELIHQNDIDKVFINEAVNFRLAPENTDTQYLIRPAPGRIIKVSHSLMPLRAPPVA
ncbi:MAG: hypothetical protein ACQETA_00970 [Bacteroidota bacterium]